MEVLSSFGIGNQSHLRGCWQYERRRPKERAAAMVSVSCPSSRAVATRRTTLSSQWPTTSGHGDRNSPRNSNPSIRQIHSAEYRNPAQRRPGRVLIVGAGNSAAEITRELAPRHARVLDVENVVWCTGFRPRFEEWIDLPIHGEHEPSRHAGIVQDQPGLNFLGLDSCARSRP
jgi:hypothetical protein